MKTKAKSKADRVKPPPQETAEPTKVTHLKAQLCDVLLQIQQLEAARQTLARGIDQELAQMREDSNGSSKSA